VDLASLSNGGSADADERVRVADLYSALESALTLLEPRDRLLLKLRFEDDLSVPALVRSLGFPTRFHLYRRLSHVLKDLRSALERSGVRDAAP
jgi:DNA-directed RNA polymerase specialized sigma subunit